MGNAPESPELPYPGCVLIWVQSLSATYAPLSHNILRVIHSYLHSPPVLFLLTSNTIRSYDSSLDFTSTSPALLSKSIHVNRNSRWAAVDRLRVVVCGGGSGSQAWKSVYLVNQRGGVQVLPEMNRGHGCAGVIIRKASLFVFGSFDAKGERYCEKLRLPGANWTQLADMHRARYCFSPSVWLTDIYLCGGQFNNNTIEVLSGSHMRLLDVQLPEGSRSLSCVYGKMLVVLTLDYITTLTRSETGVTCTILQRDGENVDPTTLPVIWNDNILVIEDGELRKYSVTTGTRLA